jgi:hypothetical protein
VPAANPSCVARINPVTDLWARLRLMRTDRDLWRASWGNAGFFFVAALVQMNLVIHAEDVLTLSKAQNAYLTTRSLAEMFSAGEEKHILFHIGYENNGRSWYDWLTNDGDKLWDDHNQPTAAVSVWNVIIDSLGLSTNVARIKNEGYELHVFQDNRNARGIVVASASEKSKGDSLLLPMINVIRRDVMGSDTPLPSENGNTHVELPPDRRPSYFFTSDHKTGDEWAAVLAPLAQ